MRTLILNGHAVDVIGRRIDSAEALAVCKVLDSVEHVQVTADVSFDGEIVHIRPGAVMSTLDEVTALRAFAAVTDAELRWHPAVAS
jgi:hypothetical protein